MVMTYRLEIPNERALDSLLEQAKVFYCTAMVVMISGFAQRCRKIRARIEYFCTATATRI